MSKVISFRLNPDNPREAEALSVLEKWQNQGFSTRHTITEAIIKLETKVADGKNQGTYWNKSTN